MGSGVASSLEIRIRDHFVVFELPLEVQAVEGQKPVEGEELASATNFRVAFVRSVL